MTQRFGIGSKPPLASAKTRRVGDYMAFSSCHVFATAMAPAGEAALARGLDALRTDHRCRRAGPTPGLDSHRAAKANAQTLDASVLSPLAKVVVDRFPWGESLQQQSPLTASFEPVKKRVYDLAWRVPLKLTLIGENRLG